MSFPIPFGIFDGFKTPNFCQNDLEFLTKNHQVAKSRGIKASILKAPLRMENADFEAILARPGSNLNCTLLLPSKLLLQVIKEKGKAINPFEMKTKIPLTSEGSTSSEGKIIMYNHPVNLTKPLQRKAAGMIVQNKNQDVPRNYPLPASCLSKTDYRRVKTYRYWWKNPVAIILRSEEIKDLTAPMVAYFSGRGPNPLTAEILKPDITAPGINILAAWSPAVHPTATTEDRRAVQYNMLSGTSMACPHVSGVACYVKAFHPDWSPSAIKSAILTTAYPMDATTNPGAEFSFGSGHINLMQVVDPGLVYDASEQDYINFLCSTGIDDTKMSLLLVIKKDGVPNISTDPHKT